VLVTTGAALSRSQAANAGLEAAHGKYIQFLDEDDWIDSNHVSQLVSALESSEEKAAAYSSTQKTNATGESLDYIFREDFDPIMLMRDNYIPIHSVLFESSLLENGCGFDEAFDIYEDWDFWLQLSQYTNFQHIDSITAYYREGGDSDTAVEDVRLRYQSDNILGKARAAIFDKWLPKWTGEKVNSLIGQLDQSVLLCELDAQIHSELKRNAELQHEIEKRDTKINELELRINELELQRNELDLQILNSVSQLEQLQLHSERQSQHISELELRLNTIYDSASWKLMGPVRRVGRTLTADKNSDRDSTESDK
jgi:glycosyltransferase involved in cell wall biosynthesis